jgi:hypothetical protein
MRFSSYLASFNNRSKTRRKNAKSKPRFRLFVEHLEKRELLSTTPPFIKSVTPLDGSTITNTLPALQITFSEPMNFAQAANASNYLLFGNNGAPVSVDAVNMNVTNTVATLTYNGANPLVAGTYTLLVHGDQIHDTADNLPLALPGQLVVANAGANTISQVNVPGDGTLVDSADTPVTPGTFPIATATGDLNGDGIPDVVVADRNSNTVSIFLSTGLDGTGRPTYAAPTSLAVGTNPVAIAIGDLDKDGHLDIAVACQGSNTAQIFWGDGSGKFSAAASTTLAVGNRPTGLALGDFNNDGLVDLAVSHNGTQAGPNSSGVTILRNLGSRLFDNPVELLAGTDATNLVAADFNKDGNTDLAVLNGIAAGQVVLLLGQGNGSFNPGGSFGTVDSPTSLAVGDFNADGFPDLVVTSSSSTPTTGNLGVLLNSFGSGFIPTVNTTILNGGALQSVAVTHLNNDLFPDIVVGVSQTGTPAGNLFALQGVGDGTFTKATPYSFGGATPSPSTVGLISDALIHATTFTIQGSNVTTDLIRNGNFEARDLVGQQGGLIGWQNLNQSNSHGYWGIQTGTVSPLSLTGVPAPPQGNFAGMLDEAFVDGSELTTSATDPGQFSGTHILYQDFVVPATATSVVLSLDLDLQNSAMAWSDTSLNPSLDYTLPTHNQQVRVDIIDPTVLDPNNVNSPFDVGTSVLKSIFVTKPTTSLTSSYGSLKAQLTNIDLSQFKGRRIRLRIASANNQGQLIVGVDNVHVIASYQDNLAPTLSGLQLRNPGYGVTGVFAGNTTDPTIIGQVNDDGLSPANALSPPIGSPNNIAKVIFDTNNDGNFNGPDDVAINNWDPLGNFSVPLSTLGPASGQFPNLLPGTYTIGIQAVDKAGNAFKTSFSFALQNQNNNAWQAQGPGAINVQGALPFNKYPTISGTVTAIVADPRDQTGNTYYIGSKNGGVWKTTDGGADWTPLTDFVTDQQGNPVSSPIGGLALFVDTSQGVANPKATLYAATGVADTLGDARPSVGILRSTDNGNTWMLMGQSVFTGARISKIEVAPHNPVDPSSHDYVFVAVASGGVFGPGVYRSADAGATWSNVLLPGLMNIDPKAGVGTVASNGLSMPSVTDLLVDPNNPEDITIGLGNIGLAPVSAAAGVWKSPNSGGVWFQQVGNGNALPLDSLPHGFDNNINNRTLIGKITLAQGTARPGDDPFLYVLVTSAPPGGFPAPLYYLGNINSGTNFVQNQGNVANVLGLYKSKNGGADWTHVNISQDEDRGLDETSSDLEKFPTFWDFNSEVGSDASLYGALVVDPSNPNVVYVGGTKSPPQLDQDPTDPTHPDLQPNHAFLRVDTSNLRDTTFANGAFNDGYDVGTYFADPPTDKQPVIGAYWTDLQTNESRQGTFFGPAGDNWLPGFPTPPEFLPDSIKTLTFDNQGRLLVGTAQGIWRGVSTGFGDGSTLPTGPGMQWTDLNSNLQISDLTSVALDPVNRHILYTAGYAVGTSVSQGVPGNLTWDSSGLDPALPALNGVPRFDHLPGFNAAYIRTAPPDPTAAPGTPTTVYVSWAYTNPVELGAVYVSHSNGALGTFTLDNAGILFATDQAGTAPPLAMSPTKQFQNGSFLDELAYGTQRIYETDTSGALWDQISRTLMSDTSGSKFGTTPNGIFLSALAFAPSGADALYAGTEDGRIFVDLNNGNFNFPEHSIPWGLAPGVFAPRINGITVDPTNQLVAYAMVGSTVGVTVNGVHAGHVWRTTNGGATWTDVSSNLPDVPAYSMAIDPTHSKIYVGTEFGVYVTANAGATWVRFGQGLPNVPVVDIQFNQADQLLAIATLGRGAFMISTNTFGPAVVGLSPNSPTLPSINQATVTFNEPIDPRTLAVTQDAAARGAIINALDHSTEYRVNLVVGWYSQFLQRTPSAPEINLWVGQLSIGSTQEQVISNFVGSPEYFLNPKKGNNDNATWVNSIYQDLLGRAPTATELSTALTDLGNGTPRNIVALNDVLTSAAYRTALVTSYYVKYLRRLPTSTEITNALNQFVLSAATDEQILTGIVESVEYYQKNGTTTFVGAGTKPSAVALVDLNRDKIPDLVVADAGTDSISIFLGLAGGGFNPTPIVLALPAGAAPDALVAADFNGDNLPDIAVANSGLNSATGNSVSVFINTTTVGGPVTFAARTDLDGGNNPKALVTTDFNGDNHADLAVLDGNKDNAGKYDVTLRFGNGNGTFQSPLSLDTGFATSPNSLAQADLDGDGKADLVVAGAGGINILINDTATGTFQNSTPAVVTTTAVTSVAVGLVDTDTVPDIVATTPQGGGQVLIFQGLGGSPPTFNLPPVAFQAGGAPTGVVLADVNGDGRNDILVANNNSNGSLSVLLNQTIHASSGLDTLAFAPVISYPVGSNPVAIALADTNQDGVLDAALVNTGTNDVSTLLGFSDGSFQMPTDQSFVNQIYKDVLGRAADPSGLNGFFTVLEQAEVLRLVGPRGTTTPLTVTPVTGSDFSQYQMTFAPQTLDGTYTLVIGPNILGLNVKDFQGNVQDQNRNGITGEIPADNFNGLLAINTSDNGQFVSGLFHDLLGRAADTPTFVSLLGPVDAVRGQAVNALAASLVDSTPNLDNFVRRLFSTSDPLATGTYLLPFGNLMLRTASQAEVNQWVADIQILGLTEPQLMALLVASNEYFNNPLKGNGNVATWVNSAYQDLLGRPGNDAAAAFIINAVTSGAWSRQMATNFLTSNDEFRARIINGTYQTLLGRNANASDIAAWLPLTRIPALPGGVPTPEEQFVTVVLGSSEFFYRVGNTNTSWVTNAYTRFLKQVPSSATVSSDVTFLLNSYQVQRDNAAAALTVTTEYRSRLVGDPVVGYYEKYLRRRPTASEIGTWVTALQGGAQDEFVIANLVASNEYFQGQASGDNSQWLDHVYQDLLLRTRDSGSQGFLNALNAGTLTRLQVAQILLSSTEYRRDLVASMFDTYLRRNFPLPVPNTATDPFPELDPWVNLLAAGAHDEQLIAAMLSTAEYYNLPHVFP